MAASRVVDSAAARCAIPLHTARNTIAHRICSVRIVAFIQPDMSRVVPSSTDLNPADCPIRGLYVHEQVYHGSKFDTVDQLKQAIVLEWRALPSQRFIDHSIAE